MKIAGLIRLIWPGRGSLFVALGASLSILMDITGFLSNIGSPSILIWPTLTLTFVYGWLCIRQILSCGDSLESADSSLHCLKCSLFRIFFFALLGITLLLIAGRGNTATEYFGKQIGLIREEINEVAEDTDSIRESLSSSEIIKRPRTPGQHYRNAWIFMLVRRDKDRAWESIQSVYKGEAPNKLDSAELFFEIGRTHMSRDAILNHMLSIGRNRKDAAMLVIVARNSGSDEEAFRLYEEAKVIDPELPFAYWDVFRVENMQIPNKNSAEENLAAIKVAIAGHQAFIDVATRKPISSYFFAPPHGIDFEGIARRQLEQQKESAKTWEEIIRMQKEMKERDRRFRQYIGQKN